MWKWVYSLFFRKMYFVSFAYKTNYDYEFGNCLFSTDLNVRSTNGLNALEDLLLKRVQTKADVRALIILTIERI